MTTLNSITVPTGHIIYGIPKATMDFYRLLVKECNPRMPHHVAMHRLKNLYESNKRIAEELTTAIKESQTQCS